jgi:hypothetical protein
MVLLSALYLGWLVQALWLQHLFDYVHFPGVLLALAMCGAQAARSPFAALEHRVRWMTAAAAIALGLTTTNLDRLRWLPVCLTEGSTPRVQAALQRMPVTDWQALEQVARFLERQRVGDGELTVYDTHAIGLYARLSTTPSTRYVFTETHLRLFPSRAEEIAAALTDSRQRFVVTSLLEAGVATAPVAATGASLESWRAGLPARALEAFPYRHSVVFRAGDYLVHRVAGPLGPTLTGFQPLAAAGR